MYQFLSKTIISSENPRNTPILFFLILTTGTGYAIIIINIVCSLYYNVIIAYPIVFIWKSLLPWTTCNNAWNTPQCIEVSTSRSLCFNIHPFHNYFLHSNCSNNTYYCLLISQHCVTNVSMNIIVSVGKLIKHQLSSDNICESHNLQPNTL